MHAQTRALIRMITFIKLINMLVYFTLNRGTYYDYRKLRSKIVLMDGPWIKWHIIRYYLGLNFRKSDFFVVCLIYHAKCFLKKTVEVKRITALSKQDKYYFR